MASSCSSISRAPGARTSPKPWSPIPPTRCARSRTAAPTMRRTTSWSSPTLSRCARRRAVSSPPASANASASPAPASSTTCQVTSRRHLGPWFDKLTTGTEIAAQSHTRNLVLSLSKDAPHLARSWFDKLTTGTEIAAQSHTHNLVLSLSKDAPHLARSWFDKLTMRILNDTPQTPRKPRPRDPMYRYDEFDAEFVRQRIAQFRDQVGRRLSGELTEDEFKPLRLMNGVYLQLHAYMLRIAIPYGTLSSRQLRKLAHIARTYDRGTGHFTTRQNLQFNWPRLVDIPAILDELAQVEMHAIQTSGNCIRNVTADHFAGAAADEVADPRPYAEIIRQWSSLHPEFSFLPRKFKVSVIASDKDRAAIQLHDIGLQLKRLADGGLGFAVWVGGGQGRTPLLAKKIRDDLPEADLLSYLEAILRVYNLQGRRDNKYKARIKILVHEIGEKAFAAQVEEEWRRIRKGALELPEA